MKFIPHLALLPKSDESDPGVSKIDKGVFFFPAVVGTCRWPCQKDEGFDPQATKRLSLPHLVSPYGNGLPGSRAEAC